MNLFNQFWTKYIDDDSADITIAKRKQEISRWLLIYALVVLAFRGVAFVVYGAELLFLGETIFHYRFDLSFIALFPFYTLPFFMWLYSVRASRPEKLLIWHLFFDKFGLFLSFFSSFFSWGFRGIVIRSGFFLVNLLITKKVKRLEKLQLLEESIAQNQSSISSALTPPTEEESRVEKNEFLRNSANNMLLAYGIAGMYPRFMGSFMRIGLWDFTFSAVPISLWSIVLYSLLPFAMYLYSVKIKRTSRVILGYCFWLGIDTGLAMGLSILGFFGVFLGESEFSSSHSFGMKLLAIAINSFSYYFVSNMYRKYKKSYLSQEGADTILGKNIFSTLFVFFIFLLAIFLPLSLWAIQSLYFAISNPVRYRGYQPDYSGDIVVICITLAIIFKILRDIREPLLFIVRGVWGGIKTIFVAENDSGMADDEREKRKELHIAMAMVFLLIMGHFAYASKGLLMIFS